VESFLEFEQAPFARKELAPVKRDDRPELGVGLLAGGPGVDLGDRQLDGFSNVGFLRVLGALKPHGALKSLAIQPFGEANLPDVALRFAHLPDATLLVL